jgi:hypothetical protein
MLNMELSYHAVMKLAETVVDAFDTVLFARFPLHFGTLERDIRMAFSSHHP